MIFPKVLIKPKIGQLYNTSNQLSYTCYSRDLIELNNWLIKIRFLNFLNNWPVYFEGQIFDLWFCLDHGHLWNSWKSNNDAWVTVWIFLWP